MRPRPLLAIAERSLLASLVLYGGAVAASTLRPVAVPVARAVAQGAGCAAAAARVAATEHAFAAAAKATNVRDAFLAYIADSGAVLGGPGLSRREDIAKSPVRPGALLWGPEVVFVSAAGDLGFSTGPSESYPGAAAETKPGHGHFATIWAQQPDGRYRFLADIGTSHAAPAPGMVGVATLPAHAAPAADARCPDAPAAAPASAVAAAAAADSAYAADAARSWRAASRLHAADVRVHRGDRYPLAGRAAHDSVAAWGDAPLAAPRAALGVARSGDFAWTRGTYALGPAGTPAESGAFLRVWRHDGTAWRLAVEVLSPARPPRPAPKDSAGARG